VSVASRVGAEARAATRSFLRRRTAVFFTFFFPAIIILIFGALVETGGAGGAGDGLFAQPAGYYVPGYLAVVVLLTPLSRVGSEVARHRAGNRFEKLATTPLSRSEWLLGQTLVNVGVIGAASALVLALVLAVTDARIALSPLLVPYVVLGVVLFCGLGAILGRIADSQDGVVAAANGIGIPLLFLSETFVPAEQLPEWLPLWLSPLTYFSRGIRAATYRPPEGAVLSASTVPGGTPPLVDLGVLALLAVAFFAAGALAIPRTD
jgi:ABC-2 type transport system permease protein